MSAQKLKELNEKKDELLEKSHQMMEKKKMLDREYNICFEVRNY